MRIILILVALAVIGLAGLAIGLRSWATYPKTWHEDPLTAPDPGVAGTVLRGDSAPNLPAQPEVIEELVARVLDSWERTTLLSGEGGFTTHVVRTSVFGFPDSISVRVLPSDAGSDLAIVARTRFGGYDWGSNRVRVARLLGEVEKALAER